VRRRVEALQFDHAGQIRMHEGGHKQKKPRRSRTGADGLRPCRLAV
jgi:hypothetical protein